MIKRLIIGIKCLFGHHTESPYTHIVYGGVERVNVCLYCHKEFKPRKAHFNLFLEKNNGTQILF